MSIIRRKKYDILGREKIFSKSKNICSTFMAAYNKSLGLCYFKTLCLYTADVTVLCFTVIGQK